MNDIIVYSYYYVPAHGDCSIRVYQSFTIIFHKYLIQLLILILQFPIILALCLMLSITHYVFFFFTYRWYIHKYPVVGSVHNYHYQKYILACTFLGILQLMKVRMSSSVQALKHIGSCGDKHLPVHLHVTIYLLCAKPT